MNRDLVVAHIDHSLVSESTKVFEILKLIVILIFYIKYIDGG